MGKPAAMCLAIDTPEEETRELQEAISSSTLRIYRSSDRTGAAIGGTPEECVRDCSGHIGRTRDWETMPERR